MSDVTIKQLAGVLGMSVDKLLVQLDEAGMKFSGPEQVVSSTQKVKLLGFLRRTHGKGEKAAEEDSSPRQITLKRKSVSELTVNQGAARGKTVAVEVRQKRTYVKRSAVVESQEVDLEREDALKKLQESQARNQAEQAALKAQDKRRADEEAKLRAAEEARRAEEARQRAEAEAKTGEPAVQAEKPAKEERTAAAPRKPHEPRPADGRGRPDNEPASHKHKPKHGSHRMRDDGEDSEGMNRIFGAELHLSDEGHARRGAVKRKPRKVVVEAGRMASGQHGFSKPLAPMVREVPVGESILVSDLAQKMAVKGADVVKTLFKMGVMATINQVIDHDTAVLVIEELGHTAVKAEEKSAETTLTKVEVQGDKEPRPPVVTIMGHVDHGKTSLLDYIRRAKVAAGEAGGITQHIGAYHVQTDKGVISFLDTPGHAAFTAMRARGAKVTDIVVLVVAADDGVMPQTIEAIQHAKAAKVPMIVAINKIDKPDAKPDRVRTELLQHEIQVETLGGEVLDVEVSATKKLNLDRLLETIGLQAEILELKANPQRPAEGTVVEAKLDRGRGPVATVLVQRGTLKPGDIVVAGAEYGRVRALVSDTGMPVVAAGPSTPVEVLGFNGTPEAGDRLAVVDNEARAREVTDYRARQKREKSSARATGVRGSLEQMMAQAKTAGRKEFPLLIKGDVQGSVEAIIGALDKLGTDEVAARVLHSGGGGRTESDVALDGG